jgi:hypothetical protein
MSKEKPLVIIHGWSDGFASFKRLAHIVEEKLQRKAKHINLADYISMDDEITFDDLVTAMMCAWRKHKLPEVPYSVDVIVHSTGGLIIRDWLVRYFRPDTSPVKNLLMLAPANFGSPLAHKGQAFYGRIIKGFRSKKMFQIGKKILQGLELASPYAWQLAMKDRFGSKSFYGPGKVLCTVLIGNTGYSGISAAANEDGADGTVRAASANMNCDLLEVDFSDDPLKPKVKSQTSKGTCAFAIIDKENHSTIVFKDGGPKNDITLEYILGALRVGDNEFSSWQKKLSKYTDGVVEQGVSDQSLHGFQNAVFFVHDQFKQHIKDYFVEFYTADKRQRWLTQYFYEDVIRNIHAYGDDNSFRSVYIDCTNLYSQLDKNWEHLNVSLTALPEFKQNKNVGYRTFTDEDIGSLVIPKGHIPRYFKSNRTLLVRMILRREQAEHVFQLNPL